MTRPSVVIVGGGAAGYPVARALASGNDYDVTVIDPSSHFEWKPSLYRVLRGADRSDIGFELAGPLGSAGVSFLNERVHGIHPETQTVELADRSVPYEYLVVACGGEVIDFGIDQDEVYRLSDIRQAKAIREQALQEERVAIIGAGVTGIETAFILSSIDPSLDITLIEAGGRIAQQLKEENAARIARALEDRDIDVKTGEPVEDVGAGSVRTEEDTYDVGFVIQATGIRPTGLVREAFDSKEGVVVDRTMQSVEYDHVFGAGDAISYDDGTKVRRAYHATKEARTAAVNIIRAIDGKRKRKELPSLDAPIIVSLGGRKALYEGPHLSFSGYLPHLMHWLGVEKRFLWTYKYLT